MRCLTLILFVVTAALMTTCARAVEPAATGATAKFTFAEHIGDDCDNLVVIGDPLPALRRVLDSEAFRYITTEGHIGQMMSRDGVDPGKTFTQIEANSQLVPAEIVIAYPSTSYADFITLLKASLSLGLCSGATSAGGDVATNDLPKVQAMLLESAQSLKAPELTLWVRFRDPNLAAGLFAQMQAMAPQLAARGGVEIDSEGKLLHLKTSVGSFLPPQVFPMLLAQWGVAANPEDPKLAEIGAAFAKLEAELWLERIDDGLRLTVGARPTEKPAYPLAKLGSLWRPNDTMLMYGKWELGSLRTGLNEVDAIWQEWRDTEAGKATKSLDKEDLIGNMSSVVEQVNRASDSITFQLSADEKIDAVWHEVGIQSAIPIAKTQVSNFIPRDAKILAVDSRRSAGDLLAEQMLKAEDRLARQSLKADVRGDAQQQQIAETAIDFWYTNFADFRRLILEDAKRHFTPPYAIVVTSQGNIEQLELKFDAEGGQNQLTVRDAPFLEYAVVGRIAEPSRPLELPNDLARAFFKGFIEQVPEEIVVERDLGLGVETFGLNFDVFNGIPGNVSVALTGDVQPHYFAIDGWLVFSTSARLSKSMIDAARVPSQRYDLPRPRTGELVSFGRIPASDVADVFKNVFTLLADVFIGNGAVERSGPLFDQYEPKEALRAETLAAIDEVIRIVDLIQWASIDRGNVRDTRFRTTFAEVPAIGQP